MSRQQLTQSAVFVSLVAIAVAVRLVSETPNFSAVAAASLFAGFYFAKRSTALFVPLLAMTISDQFLGGYAKPMMLAVYASLLVPIALRGLLQSRLSGGRVIASALVCSVSFYLLTNAAVWSMWYPHTWAGIARCYTVALPFFANTLASDLLFTGSFFGLFAIARAFRTHRADARLAIEAA